MKSQLFNFQLNTYQSVILLCNIRFYFIVIIVLLLLDAFTLTRMLALLKYVKLVLLICKSKKIILNLYCIVFNIMVL